MPPFDDPFGVNSNPFLSSRRQPTGLPPLSPEEEEGVLSRLGQSALGGLGYIGGSLDKGFGGRALRGALGGRPEELLSIIPFSDSLGITNPENAVSGKQLLGIDEKDDSWGSFGAGLAAEIALDPATYLTLGGKTAAGLAAQKAGTLAKGVAPAADAARGGLKNAAKQLWSAVAKPGEVSNYASDLGAQIGQGQAALATFKLPFTSEPFAALGTGAGAENIANKLGGALDSARFSAPGRVAAPLFDRRMSSFGPSPTTEMGQRVTRGAADSLAAGQPGLMGQFLDERRLGEALGMADEATAPAANREFLRIMEAPAGAASFPSPQAAFNDPAVQTLMGDYRAELAANRPAAAGHGRAAPSHSSAWGNQYFPRQITPDTAELMARVTGDQKWMSSRNANDLARIPEFDIPGGTNALNDLFIDPMAAASPDALAVPGLRNNAAEAAEYLRGKYLKWTPQVEQELARLTADLKAGQLPETIIQNGATVPNPAFQRYTQLVGQSDQSRTLVRMASGDALRATTPQQWEDLIRSRNPLFSNNPLGEMLDYRRGNLRSNLSADAFHDLVSGAATATPGEGAVDLFRALDTGTWGNANMKNRMLATMQAKGLLPAGAQMNDLRNVFLPADIAADAARFGSPGAELPRVLKPAVDLFDSATNLTKASQTTFLPLTFPTILRNALTEGFINAAGGGLSPAAIGDIMRLRGGGTLESLSHLPAFKGLDAAAQTKLFNELALQHGIDIPADKLAAMELVGKGARDSATGAGVLAPVGGPRKGFLESLKGALPRSRAEMNPLNVRGVGSAKETAFAPVRAGQEMMSSVDDIGRRSAFLSYLQQGFEPAEAAARAKNLRLDSAALAPFEREFMSRMVPYYRWMRTAIPGMLGEIAQKPGGLVGQSIRGSNALRQNEGLIPDYVGEGLAMPIGSRGEDGTQRYLSGFGLPFEELNRIASSGPTPVASTMQRLLGNLNPLLKAPLEYATNTQFYSGRHLDDLFPRTGSVAGDQLVMNSPLGTIFRTGSRFADPRKNPLEAALMAVSPVRMTDANLTQAAQIQGRRLLEQQLRTDPAIRSFERLYVPPEMMGQLSPDEMLMLRYYQTLLQRAQAQPPAR